MSESSPPPSPADELIARLQKRVQSNDTVLNEMSAPSLEEDNALYRDAISRLTSQQRELAERLEEVRDTLVAINDVSKISFGRPGKYVSEIRTIDDLHALLRSPASPPLADFVLDDAGAVITNTSKDSHPTGMNHSPASPPEPPASPTPAPVTPEWAVRQDGRFRSLAQRIYAHLWGGKGLKLSVQDKSDLVEAITLARHAPAAAPDERVERLRELLLRTLQQLRYWSGGQTTSGHDRMLRQLEEDIQAALADGRGETK